MVACGENGGLGWWFGLWLALEVVDWVPGAGGLQLWFGAHTNVLEGHCQIF
jgi:hypothetical protein